MVPLIILFKFSLFVCVVFDHSLMVSLELITGYGKLFGRTSGIIVVNSGGGGCSNSSNNNNNDGAIHEVMTSLQYWSVLVFTYQVVQPPCREFEYNKIFSCNTSKLNHFKRGPYKK